MEWNGGDWCVGVCAADIQDGMVCMRCRYSRRRVCAADIPNGMHALPIFKTVCMRVTTAHEACDRGRRFVGCGGGNASACREVRGRQWVGAETCMSCETVSECSRG